MLKYKQSKASGGQIMTYYVNVWLDECERVIEHDVSDYDWLRCTQETMYPDWDALLYTILSPFYKEADIDYDVFLEQ